MADAAVRRCAIYTRKSSEEGLEQDYNSGRDPVKHSRGDYENAAGQWPAGF